ncbi:FIST N-terminal domain-containing protein [Actinoplanes oblitus]|uniref:FIST N-terminal domain-containing protein n=1 Tax=Actinoplanes oblitus TaxID=3040509 RepID=A0ABY8WBZ1_9ACTN|nr:FIST N-terminal domain-containing protein [Actinoplanes oblitus]WIM93210.1 FIST N-terminal domain-containing protein [Actinoplanes oblitus]
MKHVSSAGPGVRWFGTGYSTLADPAAAGAQAATEALAGRDPAVVFVFCSIGYQVPELFDALRAQVTADTVIVGCSTSGQLADGRVDLAGVAMAAWGGEGFAVRTQVARAASTRLRAAGADAAACLAGVDGEHQALLLIGDGLTGNQHEFVRGAFSVAGAAVPLVGGCAASSFTAVRTYQFHGGRDGVEIMSDTVVGVAIGSSAPLGVGIAHGWRKDGDAMVITSSRDGRVLEFDGEPALDVYLRRLGLDESVLDDRDGFQALAFHHPLGLSRRTAEDIRVIHGGDRAERSLRCLADVPQGALAWLMSGDRDALLDGAAEATGQALDALGGRPALGMLVFDCAARWIKLGDDGVRQENVEIGKRLDGVPFAGFYTNGEIARIRGALGMHQFTVVTLALG